MPMRACSITTFPQDAPKGYRNMYYIQTVSGTTLSMPEVAFPGNVSLHFYAAVLVMYYGVLILVVP